MKKYMVAISMVLLIFPSSILAEGLISESPGNAEVYFIQPADGQTLKENVKINFGLKNMGVAPAGTDRKNTGHHHLLIDTDVLPDLAQPLPRMACSEFQQSASGCVTDVNIRHTTQK
jgi:hypothetical protein